MPLLERERGERGSPHRLQRAAHGASAAVVDRVRRRRAPAAAASAVVRAAVAAKGGARRPHLRLGRNFAQLV